MSHWLDLPLLPKLLRYFTCLNELIRKIQSVYIFFKYVLEIRIFNNLIIIGYRFVSNYRKETSIFWKHFEIFALFFIFL